MLSSIFQSVIRALALDLTALIMSLYDDRPFIEASVSIGPIRCEPPCRPLSPFPPLTMLVHRRRCGRFFGPIVRRSDHLLPVKSQVAFERDLGRIRLPVGMTSQSMSRLYACWLPGLLTLILVVDVQHGPHGDQKLIR